MAFFFSQFFFISLLTFYLQTLQDVPQIILIQKRFRTNLLSISAALISTIRRMADAFSLLTISLTCPACYADTRRGQGHPGILRNWPWYAVRT